MIKNFKVDPIIELIRSAGELIMQFYNSGNIQVQTKTDNSPVTNADNASNELILKGLSFLYPNIPIISEESDNTPYEIRKNWEYCWMVDPLDGTKEFINQNGEFSVNIALIHNNKPVAGFIYFPVQGWTYYAVKGQGAFKRESSFGRTKFSELSYQRSDNHKSKIRVMISRSHSGPRELEFVKELKNKGYKVKTLPHGSAMKHCLIAEGKGDIYPKFGACSEWDTAPGQIILEEAGGKVTRTDNGESLSYNKHDFINPEFVMWGPGIPTDLLSNHQGS
ncbi:MAG: 3'(2'),5'-bisphosphate nucleotidase CysQ [Bacteroidales bacterium]|nr:3'(2'),5'-bisphosphate nucleotidase CysQ [Bacteroidales bacterium]